MNPPLRLDDYLYYIKVSKIESASPLIFFIHKLIQAQHLATILNR